MGLQKNVASQKWIVFAFDRTDNIPKTGDAANITGNLRIDGAAANAIDDTNPTELEDGFYVFDVTQAETNGDSIVICPASTTANIQVIGCPGAVWTDQVTPKLPTNYIMGSAVQTNKDDDIDAILVDTGTTLDGKINAIDDFVDTEVAKIIQILTGKWEITGNQLIMYDSDGSTPLYTFNLTQDGAATEFNPDKRTPV